ncbi:hypothetical protein [Luteimonas sp. 100069]|uniref:hypothetical protein n=1 Tax=Luteimonas sp. 100069 TaxID=2006109 RepID=UPI000F5006E8|nr:hypothetical protein [Luteimonas sp. 100069]
MLLLTTLASGVVTVDVLFDGLLSMTPEGGVITVVLATWAWAGLESPRPSVAANRPRSATAVSREARTGDLVLSSSTAIPALRVADLPALGTQKLNVRQQLRAECARRKCRVRVKKRRYSACRRDYLF